MKKGSLTVLAWVVATFGTQAPSHFLVFADHYAAVTYIRKETLFQFGILAMLIQASCFPCCTRVWLEARARRRARSASRG